MGKLVVFEGLDGSGKSTQFSLMCRRLSEEGIPFMSLAFPQYSEPSSALVRMYLSGEFGEDPRDVNPYAATTFFAVDRYASFVKSWRNYYMAGGLILADRYTTSNALHQGAKLPRSEREEFFRWLADFEYDRMALPRPDIVLFLDVPVDAALERLRRRALEAGGMSDIHERDKSYLLSCHECAEQAAAFFGWRRIKGFEGQTPRQEREIHEEAFEAILGRACV